MRRHALKRQVRLSLLEMLGYVHSAHASRRRNSASPTKHILLAAANGLMADYVLRAWDCVSDIKHLRAWITDFGELDASYERQIASRGVPKVSMLSASIRYWDLIILADHMPLRFSKSVPKILMRHGVADSKVISGYSYHYDPKSVLWPDGSPVYSLMLESSESSAEHGRRSCPQYADKIRVTGDLRVDELLSWDTRRDAVREELGIGADEKLIAVMSTWGPKSLLALHGQALLRELAGITSQPPYAAVMMMHPKIWESARGRLTANDVQRYAGPRLRFLNRREDWAPFLAASDLVISDHTSLATTYSVLGRPIIPVALPEGVALPQSLYHWLAANRKVIESPAELREAISRAEKDYSLVGVPIDFGAKGVARSSVREAILDFLEVPLVGCDG